MFSPIKLYIFTVGISLGPHMYAQEEKILYKWNEVGMEAAAHIGPEHFSPMEESRMHAMVSIAMYDLVNTVKLKNKTFILHEKPLQTIRLDASISTAAYTIYASELKAEKTFFDSVYISEINKIAESDEKTYSISYGKQIASDVIAYRFNDQAAQAMFPVEPGTKSGEYTFTSPFDQSPFSNPPFKGLIAMPGWGRVKPFVLTSGSELRPKISPYKVTEGSYTKDYKEIKKVGCVNCPERTKDQSELAMFWRESSCQGWNRIAVGLGKQKKLSTHKLAKLFLLLHTAIADSYISCMEAKMFYFYWRPVTAIHQADNDNNPYTMADNTWVEYGFPTPPIPDYPSAHASAGGAAEEVLKYIFGADKIYFSNTSTSLPGVKRSFASFSAAGFENAVSRIYIGYHFRHAAIQGRKLGRQIGKYVVRHLKL